MVFRQKHQDLVLNEKTANDSFESLQEGHLVGPHKISYRHGQTWDFEGSAENAPIDIDLIMPPHRPRLQPENHRTGMFLSSEIGPIRAKVCRHALNRSFNLMVAGGPDTDVLVWIPSNFSGYITVSGIYATFSPSFVEQIMPNAQLNRNMPHGWSGDEITVETGGRVAFCVWDVLSRKPEPESALVASRRQKRGEVWRRMFGGCNARQATCCRPAQPQTWDWDFLIED